MKIRSLKEQYALKDQCLKERLEIILPQVMEDADVDMWIVASKEYHEDPTFKAMVPAEYLTARRITMFAFSKEADGIHRYSLSMPDKSVAKFYESKWQFGKEDQMVALKRLIEEKDPKRIALNMSKEFAVCDGFSIGLYQMFKESLGEDIMNKMVNDDLLAMKFMEIRTPTELKLMPEVMSVAHDIMERMYTTDVIKPGITTTNDLEWFMKEEVNKLGLTYWFEPTMDLQRKNGDESRYDSCVIQKGDLLHCDFGIYYMNMCTDTQRLGYVAKDDEDTMPQYLLDGMKVGNRFQDIVRENMIVGRTGNEVFEAAMKQAKEEGIQAMLYSHPCNMYGHGPGPTIGLFSNQNAIPVKGDVKLSNNTVYALELNVKVDDYYYFLEETVALTDDGVNFLYKDRDKITFIK
ncbi:MAG: M24 family metallopeptidase [Erysipelotrichaceae bacterium]|nr:M24 family metallopeptidase [Erysipelotrichaceae bacterium]